MDENYIWDKNFFKIMRMPYRLLSNYTKGPFSVTKPTYPRPGSLKGKRNPMMGYVFPSFIYLKNHL